MGRLIRVDGTEEDYLPANGKEFTLEEMQGVVGGYIEIIGLNQGRVMVLNEEGKLEGLLKNTKATEMARPGEFIFAGDYICGDVLVAEPGEIS